LTCADPPSGASGCGGPIRTLVVDDMLDLRMLYRMVLESSGRFEVVGEAADGEAAVDLAARLRPDLVTLDVSMPRRDGMETLPELRRVAPDARVVMLTGFEAWRLEPMARELGAVDFLEKGIPPAELVARLLRAVGADDPAAAHRPLPRPAAEPPVAELPVAELPAAEEPSQEEDPEQLVAMIAHELRNPLTVVQGFADTLATSFDELRPEEARHFAERIAANTRYLDGVVRSVLQARSLAHGELPLARDPVDLARLLPAIAEVLRAEFPRQRIELMVPPDLPSVPLDPERLRQVLTNLVANAVRHAGESGPVVLSAEARGADVAVLVADAGPGIPRAQRERVFERFVKLGGSRGVGLGLYVSRLLVEAMGGRITIDDVPVGTTVRLTFGVGADPA
jgi:signal transduction histidine kinase